jgi:hypothetical protein
MNAPGMLRVRVLVPQGRASVVTAGAHTSTGPPTRTVSTSIARALSPGDASLATEMDAAVWTAIGLLAATSLGTLFYLGTRIDALGARIDTLAEGTASRFDALAEGTASRFDALGARIEALADGTASRFDVLMARMDARFDRVDARFDHLDERFDALAARLDTHLDHHPT